MPILGDKLRFASEYQLNDNPGGEWLFGRFCYWCGGHRVGDYELGTSLRDVLFQLERMTGDAGKRANRRFSGMSAEEVFSLLNTALFGGKPSTQAHVANEEQWARHVITPAVDVFDEWKGFLLEEASCARLITLHVAERKIQELILHAGEVDKVLKDVAQNLGALYDRAREDVR